MVEWLAVWGIGKATAVVFRPILEDLAKDVAKNAAKSYVGQCFKSVYSVIHRDPLTKATGLAVRELLELIESELVRADVPDDELPEWVDDVGRFTRQDGVQQAIASLFLDPDSQADPEPFATAWQQLKDAHSLPDGFSWEFIAKQFTKKVAAIRQSSGELRETFESLAKAQDSTALKELAGLPPDFDLETYREALVERYGNLDFASLDMTGGYYNDVRLWSVFVPQSVRECHEYDPQLLEVPKEHLERLAEAGELDAEQLKQSAELQDERRRAYVSQPARPVLDVIGNAGVPPSGGSDGLPAKAGTPTNAVILGDPGSGKSSLLRFLALRWARIDDANLRYTQPLPLLIELREYNRWECSSGKGFLKYLHEASTWHRLNQHTLNHLLEKPDRVVLLLDGLDEVFDPAERELVVNDIHRFSNEHKHVRIVLTSRVVGYKPQRLRDAEFRHFMLQDLDQEQIAGFLDKWHAITFDKPEEAATKRERLAKAIENSKSIAQLAGNPLLLTMMAILNRHQELPRHRVDLYQQCSRLLLHQWDVERTLVDFPGLSTEIGLREKTDILRSIAYAMQTRLSDNSRANYIDGTTLTSLIEDYLHTELRIEHAKAIARALVEQLRVRNFILCSLGADSYAFVHRTFLEYFCAAEIVHQFNVAKTLSEPDLIALFDIHCRDDDWREVLRLICGQIDEQFVGHIAGAIGGSLSPQSRDLEELKVSSQRFRFAYSLVQEVCRHDSTLQCLDELVTEYAADRVQVIFSRVEWAIESGSREISPEPMVWPDLASVFFENREYVVSLACERHCLNHCGVRASALRMLADQWPDGETRELLAQRAVQDDDRMPRRAAISMLAEKWPDETTRELLTVRTAKDDDESLRCATLLMLSAMWPDETTRELLERRAVEDVHESPRSVALKTLAEKWPDKTTRELLAQQAVQDANYEPRRVALQALVAKWPGEPTRELLTLRARLDGVAASVFGRQHSKFGQRVFWEYAGGFGNYHVPQKPVPHMHIKKAAEQCGIPAEEIDAQVASLSEFLGWDITQGAKPQDAKKKAARKKAKRTRRKR